MIPQGQRTRLAARSFGEPTGHEGSIKAVLVVDDDADHRAVVLDILEHEGYRVQTATNGREALALLDLALLQGGPLPDLILWLCSSARLYDA
jgi:PleD family two-component response regulator